MIYNVQVGQSVVLHGLKKKEEKQLGQSEKYQVTQQFAPSILWRGILDCDDRSGQTGR